MALTVQNLVDDCSYNTRLLLDGTGGSGSAFNLLVRFVDQAHKDAIHTSLYHGYIRAEEDVTSVASTRSYTLTATNVSKIEHVFDKTFQRELLPWSQAGQGGNLADPRNLPEQPGVASPRMNSRMPEYYQLQTTVTAGVNAHKLWIFPAPATSSEAGVLEVHYIKEVTTLAAAADKLQIPEDGRALVVAGATAYAFNYLKMPTEAAIWTAKYEALKKGERVGN